MLALLQGHAAMDGRPFRTAEEAWLWTVATLMARRDGAGITWRPEGPQRPCEPDDVVQCLDRLYRQHSIRLLHARILRSWGERQCAPRASRPGQASNSRLWRQAMSELEWALRARGIVG